MGVVQHLALRRQGRVCVVAAPALHLPALGGCQCHQRVPHAQDALDELVAILQRHTGLPRTEMDLADASLLWLATVSTNAARSRFYAALQPFQARAHTRWPRCVCCRTVHARQLGQIDLPYRRNP